MVDHFFAAFHCSTPADRNFWLCWIVLRVRPLVSSGMTCNTRVAASPHEENCNDSSCNTHTYLLVTMNRRFYRFAGLYGRQEGEWMRAFPHPLGNFSQPCMQKGSRASE